MNGLCIRKPLAKCLEKFALAPDMQAVIDGFCQRSHIDAIQEGDCVEMINDEMPLNQQLFQCDTTILFLASFFPGSMLFSHNVEKQKNVFFTCNAEKWKNALFSHVVEKRKHVFFSFETKKLFSFKQQRIFFLRVKHMQASWTHCSNPRLHALPPALAVWEHLVRFFCFFS